MQTANSKNQKKEAPATQAKSEVALREEAILDFWQEHDIFKKSLETPAGEQPVGDFVFYDGPPFATGLPHVGSLLSSIIKDVVGRYQTMKGYRVERRWGWDCHGLPIENLIEKELGLKDKKAILDLGIDKFNEACRAAVLRYADDWKEYVTRIGRWTEYDGAYKTMDNSYMESVWWFLSEMHKKDWLYQGRKVLLYCPHCETPLSKAEIAMDNSYKDVTEESVTVEFRVVGEDNTALLAWTTTPWTLPGNVALAVHPDISYVTIEKKDEGVGRKVRFILAKDRLEEVFGDDHYEIVAEQPGSALIGMAYEPLYTIPKVDEAKKDKAHTVLPADFVTTEDGTGIVHTAVIYGEDDYQLGLEHDLPMVPLLDAAGHFTTDAPEFIQGKYFKQSEKLIKADLEKRSLLFSKAMHTHSYPHCYRCGTALLYNALTSWFINTQDIKQKMLATNEDINWYPEHLKHGRYQNILENAPDWTISRNRFWATPLPIWQNPQTGEYKVFGSIKELQEYVPKSGNTYYTMRHGESKKNVSPKIVTDKYDAPYPLTEKGIDDVKAAAASLKGKVDLIVSSPVLRAKETAELMVSELGLNEDQLIFDERIRELECGEDEGKLVDEFFQMYPRDITRFEKKPTSGENWSDGKQRMGEFLYDIERSYRGKRILIVSHGDPLALLHAAAKGLNREETVADLTDQYPEKGVIKELSFTPMPHNDEYELDLHRPYIDDIELYDGDVKLERVPEVVDCWAESGSMPFAAFGAPHQNNEKFKKSFPADFIAEYIAQTRTWFYYMHTVSVLLFGQSSFKNVVTTGNVLAGDGAKMSKSKQNYTDPLINLNEFGADAMRYYLMSSVVMQAEDMSFKDEELKEVRNRLINILWNTFKFFDLYQADWDRKVVAKQDNVLDQWIRARLNELVAEVTKHMDGYDMTRATRPFRLFVEDFSTWYVRRSRDRMKGQDESDKQAALATMHLVLETLARLLAPVMPFVAESIYQGIHAEQESVHLTSWPKAEATDERLLEAMATTRQVVSLALEARMSAKIKIRQPLSTLRVKTDSPALYDPYVTLIKDEVNVKEVVFDSSIENEVELDTTITPELQAEGDAREFIRSVQEMRKQTGLAPSDRISLEVHTSAEGEKLIEQFQEEIKKVVGADLISFGDATGTEVKAGEHEFIVQLVKV